MTTSRSADRALARLLWLAGTLATAGCGGEGAGTVAASAYGEAFIEAGIPAEAVGDGWSVAFDRFVVDVGDVTVGGVPVPVSGPVDLTEASEGRGHPLGTARVPAGAHSASRFELRRIDVAGRATRGARTIAFVWQFDRPVAYANCETTTSVPTDGAASFEITVHADHLLYDSLVADSPGLVFDPLAAADANDDGTLTREELEAHDIGPLDPGSEGGVDDLWTWLEAQVATLGHVDGEGHCDAAVSN